MGPAPWGRFIILRQDYYSANRQLTLGGKHSNITRPIRREKIILRIIEVSMASYTYIVVKLKTNDKNC